MDLTESAFATYVARIAPPATQMDAAQRSHNALRNYLCADDYFGPMILADFLNGSYARHTVVRPIKDVDVIIVVSQDWLQATPADATESVRRKLAQRYDDRRTRRRGRAVRVELYDMQIDVVLAAAPDGLDHPLRIPDRDLGRWIQTHPKEQLRLIKALQSATDGNYSRLVRLLKAWTRSRVPDADWPGSFVIECSAYRAIANHPSHFTGRLDEAFVQLLRALRSWDFGRGWFQWNPLVPDPALPAINVAKRWHQALANNYRTKLDVTLRTIDTLERSRSEDTAVAKWQKIFNDDRFPGPSALRRR